LESTAAEILNPQSILSRLAAYLKLTKFRLGSLVVFSAVVTYVTAADTISGSVLVALSIGGLLVTSAANGFNQVIERDLDKLMDRTRERPLPMGLLTPSEALIFCTVCTVGGTLLLWIFANPLSGILGLASVLLYALIYTPMKRRTSLAVLAGAFPGALPTLIGGVAATEGFGEITFFVVLLFMIQFVWQFPHFWSLAWFNSEDYAKAGFYLLPSKGGKDQASRFQILLYSMFLLVVSLFPFIFGFTGILSATACVLCGFALLLQAYNFYRLPEDEQARRLFMVALLYLPLVQLALMTRS
jgi:heme o synthase